MEVIRRTIIEIMIGICVYIYIYTYIHIHIYIYILHELENDCDHDWDMPCGNQRRLAEKSRINRACSARNGFEINGGWEPR